MDTLGARILNTFHLSGRTTRAQGGCVGRGAKDGEKSWRVEEEEEEGRGCCGGELLALRASGAKSPTREIRDKEISSNSIVLCCIVL